MNNPVNLSDPTGLRPGDRYLSLECAALNAIEDANEKSIPENREYSGWIYQNEDDGTYSYTEAVKGGKDKVRIKLKKLKKMIPKGSTKAANYNTHGAYVPTYNDNVEDWIPGKPRPRIGYRIDNDGNESFSYDDKILSDAWTYKMQKVIPAFLGTPHQRILKYTPTATPLPSPGNGTIDVLNRDDRCGCLIKTKVIAR
jgi:hypothetical protein